MRFAFLAVALLAAPARATLSSRDIYQKAGPAVVLIIAASEDGAGELGTGSVIDEDGRVLTNAHVILRESSGRPFDKIRVYFKPARLSGDPKVDLQNPVAAKVVKYDRALDLALLELEHAPPKAVTIPFSDSDAVAPGEAVVAIGHPEQGGLWTLTQGVVSTVIADLGGVKGKHAFQTDASINRGNSGGPLIGKDGGLVGVNTSMARKAADGLTITSVNFAVKSNVARDWLADTRAKHAVVAAAADAAAGPAKPAEPPKPAESPKPAEAPAAAEAAPATPTPPATILTPARPYKIEDLIAKEIKEMEDLESEMRREVERRRGGGSFR